MGTRLVVAAGCALAVAASASACGQKATPRSPAEISAEASFLGSSLPTITPTGVATTPAAGVTTAPAGATITMVTVGDAYTAGTSMGGLGAKNWSALVAAHFGWTSVPLAAAGAGFLEQGTGPGTFVQRVPEVVAAGPGVVLIWSARNDVGSDQTALKTAIVTMLTQLKQQLPTAQVVLIGPSWVNKSPSAEYLTSDATEKAAAAQVGVAYVDDLDEDWLDGAGLVDADGIHPTDAGQAAIATKVIADLTTLGVPANAVAGTPKPTTSSPSSATGSATPSS